MIVHFSEKTLKTQWDYNMMVIDKKGFTYIQSGLKATHLTIEIVKEVLLLIKLKVLKTTSSCLHFRLISIYY